MITWWRRRSLRARLLVIGAVGLCLGFLLGGLALIAALGLVLQRSVDAEAERTAPSRVRVAAIAAWSSQPIPARKPATVLSASDSRARATFLPPNW